jgi:peptidoglycan-associated lipoprotein
MKKSFPVLAMILLMVASAGCGKKPVPPPGPVTDTSAADREDEARRAAQERARLEAEEAARRARLEAEERARREAEMAAVRRTLEEMVFFDYDEAEIKPEARALLDAKARILRDNPAIRIRIAGHCDERGSNEYNLALGNRRAYSIQSYLVGFGIDAGRFESVSFGEERPLATGSNEASWSRNRRGEFQILSGLGNQRN